MKRTTSLSVLVLVLVLVSGCGPKKLTSQEWAATATAEAREKVLDEIVEKEVETIVKETVIVEKEVEATPRTIVKETVVVEKIVRETVVEVAPTAIPSTVAVTDTWEEVDFHPTGDTQDVVNVNHDGQHRVTVSWFFAGPADKGTPSEACSAHVTTSPKGERITLKGAFRTWQWTGTSAPSKTNIQQLVADWTVVLENEPRGMCAKEGAYTVSWQNASLAP